MTNVMRMSKMYAPTLKEDPSDAELSSHKLLTRAAMIRKTGSGLYSFLPLGKMVLNKVDKIVKEETEAAGAYEILMPIVQPAELWHESSRWDDYGPELMRITDRHDNEFCLGPTHEELVTSLIRDELRSYKDLPVAIYQSQVKFRDEIRPRFGLMRSREFMMNDCYSFHADQESLQEFYDRMSEAYGNICDRLGMQWRPVKADSGQIGGSETTEFMALADAGEAEIVYCDCGYAADSEASQCIACATEHVVEELTKVSTPGVKSIAELSEFLDIPESSTVKALSGKDKDGNVVIFFIPGDHELNEIKVEAVAPGFELLNDDELEEAGLVRGSIGPVGLPENIRTVGDVNLQYLKHWTVGANEIDHHYVGARLDRDFTISQWEDLCLVQENDLCPECRQHLKTARGIEVSQVFQLGTKYSESMGATFMDEAGEEKPFVMGCYGVGVTRAIAAIVEQNHDENGISWPVSIAPAHVCVIPLTVGDEEVQPAAERIARDIAATNAEVVIDDRNVRAGVKFADADLIGWPLQVVVGKRGLKNGVVEVKLRRNGKRKEVPMAALGDLLSVVEVMVNSEVINYEAIDAVFD